MQHEKVKNCVAVAIKDREHEQGDLPLIVVELADPKDKSDELLKELKEYVRHGIELRSQPADIVFVDEIPLTKVAKNDYMSMEKRFKDMFGLSRRESQGRDSGT